MKVLLTGASGFVGSHILDTLFSRGYDTVLLLRPTSDTRLIAHHLPAVEIRRGSIDDLGSLLKAMAGVSHVVHCAGLTKAAKVSHFYAVNHVGTRNVVQAVNAQNGRVERLLHVSSLAAAGPAVPAHPAREDRPCHPVSDYGKSKLAAELEVRNHCRSPHVILRPPAVYGPGDTGFLTMFKAVQHHLLLRPSRSQALSLVFVKDLAEVVVSCLGHPAAAGKTYFAAARSFTTGRAMAEEIAAQMGLWTIPCPIPTAVLWPFCLSQELISRISGKASLLNLQKFNELRAPGWVCDPALLERETGCMCRTELRAGIAETLSWYRRNHWLA